MKKKSPKKFLNRFTIIDILIIICVIAVVIFAFIHINSDDDQVQSMSFDSSTMNKVVQSYLPYYDDGKIVKSHVGGYNASSGKYEELYGDVMWIDDDKGSNVKVLIDVNGTPVLTGLETDVPNADLYIQQITLETDNEVYPNVTDIQLYPMNISTLDDLIKNIPSNTNYTITTNVATTQKDSLSFQELTNILLEKFKEPSAIQSGSVFKDQLSITRANKEEILTANNILGTISGQTDFITIRIYNSTNKEIQAIKNDYKVKYVKPITSN
jgi:hypothetical protein